MCNDGEGGVRDARAARLWFGKAAHLGQPQAQQMLGIMMFNGEGGREDREKARGWLARSAEAGRASRYWHAKQSGQGPIVPMGPRQGYPCMEAGNEVRRSQVPRKEAPDGSVITREQGGRKQEREPPEWRAVEGEAVPVQGPEGMAAAADFQA